MNLYYRITIILALFITLLPAQEKIGEMALGEPEEIRYVVRNPRQSAIIIVSEIPDLQFESTRIIEAVSKRGDSEWILKVEPGRQFFTIRAPGYQPVNSAVINMQARHVYRIKVTQVRAVPGILILNSEPPDAGVKIDGIAIQGRTPLRLEGVSPGRLNVEIKKEQYRSAFNTLEIKSGEETGWTVMLTQTAVKVHVNLVNEDVTDVGVLVNGEPKGIAPGIIYLEPGTYTLILQKPGFEYPEKVINIDFEKDEIRLSEELIPLDKPIYKKWWFYAGTAALVATAAILISTGGEEEVVPLSTSPPAFP